MRSLLGVVVILGACGDGLTVESLEEDPMTDPEQFDPATVTRFVPDVCAVRTWPTVLHDGRDVDLSVVPTATGATIVSVARQGGPLRGFNIDGHGQQLGGPAGVVIRDDVKLTSASVAFVGGRLVTAAASDGIILFDLLSTDLARRLELGHAAGTLVAEIPMSPGRADRVATIGGDAGLNALRFDDGWTAAGSQPLSAAAPLALTAAPYLADVVVAWSTEHSCHMRHVLGGVASSRNFPCLAGRLVMNSADRRGLLVYESDGRIMRSDVVIGGESEIANQAVLAPDARSPRIAFDGTRYWVSYLDARNDVVVGYLDEAGTLVSMALEGTQPETAAYELTVVNDGVWVFAIDASGVGAQRICLKPLH